jgi:endonuclease YncB( thermonuclease family)
MAKLQIFWDPQGFELDSLGEKRYSGPPADGDTPSVRMAIRMLSIDAPETNYPGIGKPSKSDERLAELADWLRAGQAPVEEGLAQHLLPRLATGQAGTLQEQQGEQAKRVFKDLLDERLTRPNGSKRNVFLQAADEHFDQYGRLLAYLAPYYSKQELAALSLKERATFNLLMVESGWAAPFLIYPSLPKYRDLVLFHSAAQEAVEQRRGAWAEPLLLTGYEWRLCIRLQALTKKLVAGQSVSTQERYGWAERYCADMTTREIFEPQDYHRVAPHNRLFIWPQDVNDAVGKLNLGPG